MVKASVAYFSRAEYDSNPGTQDKRCVLAEMTSVMAFEEYAIGVSL